MFMSRRGPRKLSAAQSAPRRCLVDPLRQRAVLRGGGASSGSVPLSSALVHPRGSLTPVGAAEPMHANAHFAGWPGGKVLVAEDSPVIRRVVRRQFERMGFEVDVVVDGRHGLEYWRRGAYALVLTDLHMPGLDGCALSAAIRAEESPLRRTPIVLLTASTSAEDELRCRSAGVDAYLIKPVRLPLLRLTIERLLELAGSRRSPRPNLRTQSRPCPCST